MSAHPGPSAAVRCSCLSGEELGPVIRPAHDSARASLQRPSLRKSPSSQDPREAVAEAALPRISLLPSPSVFPRARRCHPRSTCRIPPKVPEF